MKKCMKEWRENSLMKNRWPAAYKIIEELEQAGFEAFVVGGLSETLYVMLLQMM